MVGTQALSATSANSVAALPLMSIVGGSVEEGGVLEFVVTLDKASGVQVRADYQFDQHISSATAGKDLTAKRGSVVFEPGTTRQSIHFQTLQDTELELDEHVTVSVRNPTNANLRRRGGYPGCPGSTGTCIDAVCCACGWILDDEPSSVRVSDARDFESAGSLSFKLKLNRRTRSAVTVKFSTKDGTAKSDEDYTATSKTVTFGSGQLESTVMVPITADAKVEEDETFTVHLTEPMGIAVADGEGTGTIRDDDGTPNIYVFDAQANEGRGRLQFSVTLSRAVQTAVEVDFSTADGTAKSGEDYTQTSTRVTFRPLQMTSTVEVPVTDDQRLEADETLTVTLSNASGGAIRGGTGTGTILNDDRARLTLRGSSAPEGGTIKYALSLDSGLSSNNVTVTCQTPFDHPWPHPPPAYRVARLGHDYPTTGGFVVFAPGETEKVFEVPTIDDGVDEDEEAVVLDCWGGVAFAPLTADARCPWRKCNEHGCSQCSTITDNDPDAELSVSDVSVLESVGTATVAGTLSRTSERYILVNWSTASGTAESGKDFEPRGSYRSFSPSPHGGGRAFWFDVPIIDDEEVEPDETFAVRVTSRRGVSIADGEATVTIVNDDEPPKSITLEAVPERVSEGGGPTEIAVTATLDGKTTRTEATEVTVSVSGGGDPDAVDFAAVDDFTITIAAGERSGTGTFTLAPEDDNVEETDETVAVDGRSDLDVTGDAVELADDDEAPSRIVLTAAPQTVSEGAGETFVEVGARLDGAARTAATEVVVSASGGGDPDAVDFAAVADFAITIGAGATVGTAVFALTPEDDDLVEADETLSLSGASDLPVAGTAVTITDDDAAAREVLLSARPRLVSEGDGPTAVTVTASLSGAARRVATTVTVSVSGGGDAEAVDFAPVRDFAIVIAANASSGTGTFTLRPEDDATAESDERLRIAGRSDLPVTPTSVTLADDDEESTRILLSARPSLVSEGDGPTAVTVTASLSGAARRVATTVTVSVSGGGDADAVDFAPVPDFAVVVAANASSGAGTFTLAPEDDDAEETDETLTVSGASDLPVAPASVVLADDDDARVLRIADAEAAEGAAEMAFAVTLDGAAPAAVAVDYATADPAAAAHPAAADADYEGSSGTLTFAPGEVSRTIAVALVDDALDEPDEAFAVVLSGVRGAVLGRGSAAGTIRDDDDAPSLSVADASGGEDAGSLAFAATLSAPSGIEVSATYATADGSATAGVDYAAATGTVVFAPGEVLRTITVSVLDDALDEADEAFALALSELRGAVPGRVSAAGTILDDDDTPSLSVADASGGEDAGALAFAATLSAPSGIEASASYATADGTAAAGADYAAAAGTVVFAPGEVSKTISVPIVDDDLHESDEETFGLRLSELRGAVPGRVSAAGTIRDDDDTPSLSVADAAGGEDAGALAFAATLSAPSGIEASASYATADGTAEAGSDYERTSGTLRFAPGEVSKTIRVPVIDDDLHESDDETFELRLSGFVAAAEADGSATGTIRDDDLAPPVLAGRLPPALLCVGGTPYELDLAEHFAGEALRFTAVSSTPEVATAALDGSRLTIVPGAEGEASVAVTAANDAGSAGGGIDVVVVTDPAETEAVESALASIGRGVLTGVSGSVRARFEAIGTFGDRGASTGGPRDLSPVVRGAGVAGRWPSPPMHGGGRVGWDERGRFDADIGADGGFGGTNRSDRGPGAVLVLAGFGARGPRRTRVVRVGTGRGAPLRGGDGRKLPRRHAGVRPPGRGLPAGRLAGGGVGVAHRGGGGLPLRALGRGLRRRRGRGDGRRGARERAPVRGPPGRRRVGVGDAGRRRRRGPPAALRRRGTRRDRAVGAPRGGGRPASVRAPGVDGAVGGGGGRRSGPGDGRRRRSPRRPFGARGPGQARPGGLGRRGAGMRVSADDVRARVRARGLGRRRDRRGPGAGGGRAVQSGAAAFRRGRRRSRPGAALGGGRGGTERGRDAVAAAEAGRHRLAGVAGVAAGAEGGRRRPDGRRRAVGRAGGGAAGRGTALDVAQPARLRRRGPAGRRDAVPRTRPPAVRARRAVRRAPRVRRVGEGTGRRVGRRTGWTPARPVPGGRRGRRPVLRAVEARASDRPGVRCRTRRSRRVLAHAARVGVPGSATGGSN